jgi:hypothetical protein
MFNPLVDNNKLDQLSQEELVEKINYLQRKLKIIQPSGNANMYNQLYAIYMGHVAFYNNKFNKS